MKSEQLKSKSRALTAAGLLCLAFAVALAFVEFVTSGLIGYPRYPGSEAFVLNHQPGQHSVLAWLQPRTRIWNVEGGNITVELNNIGLPGSDVDTGAGKRYIFVLGSSFVEGYQFQGVKIATSVFQQRLSTTLPSFQVMNLGASGANPQDLWFRSRFFERHFTPSYVLLILDERSISLLSHQEAPLSFELCSNFGEQIRPRTVGKLFDFALQRSAFGNLILESRGTGGGKGDRSSGIVDQTSDSLTVPSSELEQCLLAFKRSYGERLAVINIVSNADFDKRLSEFCSRSQILELGHPDLVRHDNRIGGRGHLNEVGNQELGAVMYEAFQKLESADSRSSLIRQASIAP